MPTAIELFSGCGGLSTGLLAAGFTVLSAIEINETAAETYRLNHPEVNLIVDDIRNVTAASLLREHHLRVGELDLLAGCSPCQGFSRLRKGTSGQTDPRNQLVFEFIRLVRGLRPKTIFMENVPGLITTEFGNKIFKKVHDEFDRLGYQVDYQIGDILSPFRKLRTHHRMSTSNNTRLPGIPFEPPSTVFPRSKTVQQIPTTRFMSVVGMGQQTYREFEPFLMTEEVELHFRLSWFCIAIETIPMDFGMYTEECIGIGRLRQLPEAARILPGEDLFILTRIEA